MESRPTCVLGVDVDPVLEHGADRVRLAVPDRQVQTVPTLPLRLGHGDAVLQQQPRLVRVSIPCSKVQHPPPALLLAVDVGSALDQELDHRLSAVPHSVVQHAPPVLVLGSQVRSLGKEQRCDGNVGGLGCIVEGSTLPVVPPVHILALLEDGRLEPLLDEGEVAVPGGLQQHPAPRHLHGELSSRGRLCSPHCCCYAGCSKLLCVQLVAICRQFARSWTLGRAFSVQFLDTVSHLTVLSAYASPHRSAAHALLNKLALTGHSLHYPFGNSFREESKCPEPEIVKYSLHLLSLEHFCQPIVQV